MKRSHPLVEARRLEYEFSKVFKDLEKSRAEPEYALDIEFFNKLEELRGRYGYSLAYVADLVAGRYVGEHDLGLINTETVRRLLDLRDLRKSVVSPNQVSTAVKTERCPRG